MTSKFVGYIKLNLPSMVHLAGGGILTDILSIYVLIVSRCFSQKCCTVSRMGYGSNTLIRCDAAAP